MSDELAPITDDYLTAMHGPCATGDYRCGEQIAYHDGGEKQGTIIWIHTHGDDVLYIVSDGEFDCIYVLEEKVIGIVRKIEELSPV